ncbi:MAG: hypothetical protein FJ279_22435, partial [Planctomycetes bacterium]|nr:hypothetical protein [Planctomycetota bacterium]
PVKYWEVDNEPEAMDGAYEGLPQDYVNLLQAADTAITAADSSAVITSGGAMEPLGEDLKQFWRDVFSFGGNAYFDVMNFHYNSEKNGATANTDRYEGVLDFFGGLMRGAADVKPMWITELGTYAGAPVDEHGNPFPTQTEEFQASWYLRYYVIGFSKGVDKYFPDLWGAAPPGAQESTISASRLITSDYNVRLFFYSQKLLENKIGAFTSVAELADGQYRFGVGGQNVYVLWGSGSVPAEITGTVKVTDLYGVEQTIAASALTLGDNPVFVEAQAAADTTGPRVTDLTPAPGATVGSAATVVATFDEDLAPATVSGATYKVFSGKGLDGQWGGGDDVEVAGTVVYDANADTATFTPSAALVPGEYAVWLDGTASVTDLAGNRLDGEYPGGEAGFPSGDGVVGGDFLATFTLDATGPRVTSLTPAPDATVTNVASILVTFDEDLDPTTANTLAGPVWEYGGHYYALTTAAVLWWDAEAQAQAMGGHLVTVNDAAEQAWLTTTFGTQAWLWIGLNDAANEGEWAWASGQPVTYTNWGPNDPNNWNDEDHVFMSAEGAWLDWRGENALRGIVELTGPDTDHDGIPDSIDRNVWELRGAGPNGTLGDGDDVMHQLAPQPYVAGPTVTLNIVEGNLPTGLYQFTATDTLKDLAGNALDGEFTAALPSGNGTPGGSFLAAFTVDATGPRVTAMTPTPGATVDSAASVLVSFDEDLAAASVSGTTFEVVNLGPDGQFGTGDDIAVPGTVAYSAATDTATFTPTTALANGRYAVRLDGTASITDLAGNRLDGEFSGAFPSGNGAPGGDFVATFTVAQPESVELSRTHRRWVFRDQDGDTVTVSFSGSAGTAALTRRVAEGEQGDIETIAFDGTDAKTSLTITVKESKTGTLGDGTTVQTISGDGLGTLNMKNVDLVGNTIELDGALKKLVVDDILAGSDILLGGEETDQLTITADEVGAVNLFFPGILKTATVGRWTGGMIEVNDVGTLTVKSGALGAGIQAQVVGKVSVTGGDLTGAIQA